MMAGERDRKSRRPRFAVADLVVLIAGIGLTLALPWVKRPWAFNGGFDGRGGPPWYEISVAVPEAIAKGCLAIFPLLLWQSARLRRPLRMAELLIVACIAPLLWDVLAHRTNWLNYNTMKVPGKGLFASSLTRGHWLILIAIWTLGGAGLASRFHFRKRLSPWCASALMAVALLASYTWALDPLRHAIDRSLIDHDLLLTIWRDIAWAGVDLLGAIVPAILAISAIHDLVHHRSAIFATEWLGLALASSLLLVSLFLDGYAIFVIMGDLIDGRDVAHRFDTKLILFLAVPTLSTVVGSVIYATLGPSWRRWKLSNNDDRGDAPKTPEA